MMSDDTARHLPYLTFPRFSFFTFSPQFALGNFVTPELLSRIDRALDFSEAVWSELRAYSGYMYLCTGLGAVTLVIYSTERHVASRGKCIIFKLLYHLFYLPIFIQSS